MNWRLIRKKSYKKLNSKRQESDRILRLNQRNSITLDLFHFKTMIKILDDAFKLAIDTATKYAQPDASAGAGSVA